jgi:hypothetical protein
MPPPKNRFILVEQRFVLTKFIAYNVPLKVDTTLHSNPLWEWVPVWVAVSSVVKSASVFALGSVVRASALFIIISLNYCLLQRQGFVFRSAAV